MKFTLVPEDIIGSMIDMVIGTKPFDGNIILSLNDLKKIAISEGNYTNAYNSFENENLEILSDSSKEDCYITGYVKALNELL